MRVAQSLMVANWKMYKTVAQSRAFAKELLRRLDQLTSKDVQQVLCPTLPALYPVVQIVAASLLKTGAQTLDLGREGANTGAVSGFLLREAGADYVIVGHSERRRLYGETDALVRDKAAQAAAAGLVPIVCVGESREQRESGQTDDVIVGQVATVVQGLKGTPDLVVAYEPVWAIGTGLVPDAGEANRVASVIRDTIADADHKWARRVRILYGGSVNRDNIREFAAAPELNGALVGGASLDVAHWLDLNRGWGEVR